ncbi:hypothetical protein MCOR27_005641 [Pyricularia oryzae]|uniref:Uncharacterized protein n=1 Tax=Pyricularia grisea TaxID=148305 RepID=A0ABQ8NZA7_PYRGI|nr:hypothetical protein MCOR01_008643 [Pyricularia oryzae]KAI6303958.1 hypothetical protein MCOR33_000941 [Pyricularia grisea]KAH9439294.1 hypothetical protein MCOR02_002857 [Pyricularia oryzae]KAI6252985.1 hypothetical protein MCOR19_010419 [Pyricularia oryzae]KAI6278338.1 hypothetical protein MCOR27_005641 [Pyricularia oryzae]
MYNTNSSFRGSDVHPGNACNAQILDARDQRQKGGAIDEMKRFMWEGMMFGPIGTIHRPHLYGYGICTYQHNLTGPGIGCEIFWANGKAKSPEIDIYVTMAGTIIG